MTLDSNNGVRFLRDGEVVETTANWSMTEMHKGTWIADMHGPERGHDFVHSYYRVKGTFEYLPLEYSKDAMGRNVRRPARRVWSAYACDADGNVTGGLSIYLNTLVVTPSQATTTTPSVAIVPAPAAHTLALV